MARIRTIKPEFFLDEEIAEKLTAHERLLWIGLWCLGDREGRMEDRPKFIKSQVFPYENINVNAALQKLHEHGYIIRYVIERPYIQIKNFLKYQRPYHKEPESVIPLAVIAASTCGYDRKENAGLGNGHMDIGMDKKERKDGTFLFWDSYPERNGKKDNKQKAIAEWMHLKPEEKLKAAQAIIAQKAHYEKCKANNVFVSEFPDAFRWLRDKRFNDEVKPQESWQEKFVRENKQLGETNGTT